MLNEASLSDGYPDLLNALQYIAHFSRLSAEGHYPIEIGVDFHDRIHVLSQLFTTSTTAHLDENNVRLPNHHMGLHADRRYLMTYT